MGQPLLGWFDLSPEQMGKAREFIREIREEGVLDELGFGVLQSSIADILYPGTTTVMTRARYLYFIPAIYEQIERDRVPSARVARESKRRQHALCEVLKKTEPAEGSGVIGRDAGERLQRFPSNIYWNGLRTLGLFTQPLSENAYQRALDDHHARTSIVQDDDSTAHVAAEEPSFWASDRPRTSVLRADGTVRDDVTFELTAAEARDLSSRITACAKDGVEPLVSVIVSGGLDAEFPWPWDVPTKDTALRSVLDHAGALSAMAWGMTLQYYALLEKACAEADLPGIELDIAEAFDSWWSEARPILREWDLEAFLVMPAVFGALRSGDREDLRTWRDRCVAAKDSVALLKDATLRELIRRRERRLKPYKARLVSRRQLERWEPPRDLHHLYALGYRHRIGMRFARDIRAGLRASR